MLQAVDELDDAIGALRLCYVGFSAEIGLLVAGGVGIGSIGVAVAAGAEVTLACSATLMLSVAAALKVQRIAA